MHTLYIISLKHQLIAIHNILKNGKNHDLDNLHISKYYGILLWCEGFLLCCDDVFRQREPSKEYNKRNILHKTWFPVFAYFCFVHFRRHF